MLIVLVTIGFFLYSLRSLFFWTFLWQSNAYEVHGLQQRWKSIVRGNWMNAIVRGSLFFFVFLYGVVVVNEAVTPFYHIFSGMLFLFLGILFLLEVMRDNYVRPVFTLRALAIMLPAIFLVALLYMVPLVDMFLWLVLIVFSIPVIVAIFVALLAFPAEIYLDYLSQKTLDKIQKNPSLLILAVVGQDSKQVKRYLYGLLRQKYRVVRAQQTGIADILQAFTKSVTPTTDILIFEVPEGHEKIIDKISKVVKVDILVVTPSTFTGILHILARQSLCISFMKNVSINTLLKKKKKNFVMYGTQKSFRGTSVKIAHEGRKIFLGKESFYFSHRNMKVFSPSLLPAVYIGRKVGMGARKIQSILQSTEKES